MKLAQLKFESGFSSPRISEKDESPHERLRTFTANFGTIIEMEETYGTEETAPNEPEIQAALEKKLSKYSKHKNELELLYEAFVKKKSKIFFSTNRRIVLYSNGCFGQYRINTKTNEMKLFLEPCDMVRIERNNNWLTIHCNIDSVEKQSSYTYKFSNVKQAVTWQQAIRAFIK